MTIAEENLARIEKILTALGELGKDVVFVGGACTQFYVPNPDLHDFRPTVDIDCIIKVYNYPAFSEFETALRLRGFTNDISAEAPLIRYIYDDIKVDFIPDESSIVGFKTIPWFREGRKYAESRKLPSQKVVKVLPLAYFLAAKLEAWKDRGKGDYIGSPDMEDVICIIDGLLSLDELHQAQPAVRHFLQDSFNALIQDDAFRSSIAGHIGYYETVVDRAAMILDKIHRFVS